MAEIAAHERLRRERARRGESLEALSTRTGLRVQHVRAIEEGRFADLPPGIYGRAAIRGFAAAYSLDPEEVVAACESLLPPVEDPIDGLARMRGVATTHAPAADAPSAGRASLEGGWRPLAAATLDGTIAGALLLVASTAAALMARVSVAALSASALSLFLVGLFLGAAYYVWLGGLSGTTFGEHAVGRWLPPRDPRPLTLPAIARRTLAAATADARAIRDCGAWLGRRLIPTSAVRNAPPTAPSPSPLPPHGREEVLTWSMSRRASVPPPPLHPRRG